MFWRPAQALSVPPRLASPIELVTAGRWENEGGVPITTTAAQALPATPKSLTASASEAIDDRQDQLMSQYSSDGRPPSHRRRMIEWWWFGIGMTVTLGGIAGWALLRGVRWPAIGAGVALSVLLLVSALPILAAGLLRGREERIARRRAVGEQIGLKSVRIARDDAVIAPLSGTSVPSTIAVVSSI